MNPGNPGCAANKKAYHENVLLGFPIIFFFPIKTKIDKAELPQATLH